MRADVPSALRDHLGGELTEALRSFVAAAGDEWKQDVLNLSVERFERRLTEEISKLRVEMAEMGAQIRKEMAEMGAQIRKEMAEMGAQIRRETAEMGAQIRKETAAMGAQIREEMAGQGASTRGEIAAGRAELLKWSFLFWVGQVAAMAALLAFMLRGR